MARIFVATPTSLPRFQDQVRAIPEGHVEFYMHEDSLDLFIPEGQAALLKSRVLDFHVMKILDGSQVKVFYDHIPAAIADLSHREEAMKSAIRKMLTTQPQRQIHDSLFYKTGSAGTFSSRQPGRNETHGAEGRLPG